MVGDVEKIHAIEAEIDELEKAYAIECSEVYKSNGFDIYAPKWSKKIDAIAKRYARKLYDLKEEHDEIRERLDAEAEARRKSRYKDPGV